MWKLVMDLPDLLTVEEAARYLRIGRTKAYAMTRQWRASGGRCGLPVVDLDNVLRVPRHRLEQLIGTTLAGTENSESTPASLSAVATGARSRSGSHLTADANPAPQAGHTPDTGERAPEATPTLLRTRPRRRHARPESQLDLFESPSSASPQR